MKNSWILSCLFGAIFLVAMHTANASAPILNDSQQLLLVNVRDVNASPGVLQRYERDSTSGKWVKIGPPIAVVVGKNGLGWGAGATEAVAGVPDKKEGDLRSPIGVFGLGPAFGFAPTAIPGSKLSYLPLTDNSVCVDDQKSSYYNQIVDSSHVSKNWDSGEQMWEIPGYKFGAVIEYNHEPAQSGNGSCIFLHIWKNANAGTAGCVATSENDVTTILAWLNSSKNPVIAIYPANYPLELND